MSTTTIEWTDFTWNPVSGCTKVSQGCKHCYAERLANRFWKDRPFTEVRLHPERLRQPATWRKPRTVFVNSMSDLFHESVPDEFIRKVFATMAASPQHTFQILTKRSDRLGKLGRQLCWPENVWMGVSVEDGNAVSRIDDLRRTPANIRFLSLEPLIGPLPKLKLGGIHWVIVGGESGPGARPMMEEWVQDLLRQCRNAGTAFFFKQWGGVFKARHGRLLNDRTYDELPDVQRQHNRGLSEPRAIAVA
jgi:protein gp37